MNKIFILFSLFFGAIVLCQPNDSLQSKINQLKMNQVQVIGSHNSYRLRMDENLFKWFSRFDSTAAAELDYSHFPLAEQFSIFGIRQVELDVYYDPEGGLFDKRMGNIVCKDPLRLHNPDLLQPGLKVLHFPDIDYETNYYSFTDALQEIKDWSEEHSKHLPIFVLIEVKDEGVPDKFPILSFFGFIQPLEFGIEALNTIDKEIRKVFGSELERVITPDDVRGNNESLEEVILNDGWPTIGESRGKVMFGLDNQGKVLKDYISDHPALKGRIMFVEADPGTPEAAFLGINTPKPEIANFVKSGYLVRTRADADTKQARTGDDVRRNDALSSGAHFISTDYYSPDSRSEISEKWSNYSVRLPGNVIARINPVNGSKEFEGMEIE
jgi:hypothetical protein